MNGSNLPAGVCVDLCAEAAAGRLDPVAGREEVIRRMACILARRTKRNPVLLGEPGVGKTALVEGLAQKLLRGEVPVALRAARLFSLDLGALLAGTSCRGDFEARMSALLAMLKEGGGRDIVFIDELHLLHRAGRSEGGIDAGSLLKPLLARGTLSCIGATTPSEWLLVREADPALCRRFTPVPVREPTHGEALRILLALRSRLEAHHRVSISDGALQVALEPRGSAGYLPDRAIDALDEACASLRLEAAEGSMPDPFLEKARRSFDLQTYARLRSLSSQRTEKSWPLLEGRHLDERLLFSGLVA